MGSAGNRQRQPHAPSNPAAAAAAALATYSSRTSWNFPCLPSHPGRRASLRPRVRVRCGAVWPVRAPLPRDLSA